MTIRRSKRSLPSRRNSAAQRSRLKRSKKELRLEKLEDRKLLAQLAGIQTNDNELLQNGTVFMTSPTELILQFDQSATIDPNTLGAIQVTGAGSDGIFSNARVSTDFNTGGAVVAEISAQQSGPGGNGVSLFFTRSDHGDASGPTITVDGKSIQVDLNTSVLNPTTASTLVSALASDPAANQLVSMRVVTGFSSTNIAAPTINYSPLVLANAGSASAASNLNAATPLRVRFSATTPGVSGNGVRVVFNQSNLGIGTPPVLSVVDNTVTVELNSNTTTPTTAGQLVDATNANANVSALVTASLEFGSPDTVIGAVAPLTLGGANDVVINPGAVYVEESGRQVVLRFAEPLEQDLYQLSIVGSGTNSLLEIDGTPFNNGDDLSVGFEVNRGAQVVSVVPQPVVRVGSQLQQRRDEIHVYFNDDDLANATNTDFYQLIFTNDTVENTDDIVFKPTSVEYSAAADRAILKFSNNIEDLLGASSDIGTGSFRLRIGTSESLPSSPLVATLDTDAGSTFDTSLLVGNTLTISETGDAFSEGQAISLTDTNGLTRTLEFDSGYLLQVPQTLTLRIPAPSEIVDGSTFTVTNGFIQETFEFDLAGGGVSGTNTPIVYFPTDSLDRNAPPTNNLTDRILAALTARDGTAASLELSPKALNNSGLIHLGSTSDNSLTVEAGTGIVGLGGTSISATERSHFGVEDGGQFTVANGSGTPITFVLDNDGNSLTTKTLTAPAAGANAVNNGDVFTVNDGTNQVRFEFVNDAGPEPGNAIVRFTAGDTAEVLAISIRNAIRDSGLNVTTSQSGDTVSVVGDTNGFTFITAGSPLTQATLTSVINFTSMDSNADIAAKIASAISVQTQLGLTPTSIGGLVHIGGDSNVALNTGSTNISQAGVPGVSGSNVPINFIPSSSFTSVDLGNAIADAISASGLDGSALVQTDATTGATRLLLTGISGADLGTLQGLSVTSLDSLVLTASIDPHPFSIPFPGGEDDPGHRETTVESHLNGTADLEGGVPTLFYNFQEEYGFDPLNNVLRNRISENQKDRAREVFDIYSNYLGVQFVETADRGFTIVTGDLRAVDAAVPTGAGGVLGLASINDTVYWNRDGLGPGIADTAVIRQDGIAILDNAEDWDDTFGATDNVLANRSWFQEAMTQIGFLLGFGVTNDLPGYGLFGREEILDFGQAPEAIFPGAIDVLHGQHLYRPDSIDIDLYEFELEQTGLFSAETIAERLANSSSLDTVITLYRERTDIFGNVTGRELVARNDDYFSNDSRIEMTLSAGKYFLGVSASGNDEYDPNIGGSGIGGTTQGDYQVRINFRPDVDEAIVDTTGKAIDGDLDGVAGGVHNFWFRAQPSDANIFVDKAAAAPGNGSITNPFNNIGQALASASPGDIVRVVGNGGADGDIATPDDNLAYEIGVSRAGGASLIDGTSIDVPQGVTLMIDSGAILKMRRSSINVGSSAPTIDRSAGAIQVLGTPRLLDDSGEVVLDEFGQPLAGSVYFTSINDKTLGIDTDIDPSPPAPSAGSWGGIIIRSDLDNQDASRFNFEDEGIFLNHINNAEFQYGGGIVGGATIVNPIHITDTRPTISFNTITQSAHAAISASPNSFEETNFHSPEYQRIAFTADYDRVGPAINGNSIVDNSLNGLLVRVTTNAGEDIEHQTVAGRWDDSSITHIVTENVILAAAPGGAIEDSTAPVISLITLTAGAGGTLAAGDYSYIVVFVDEFGNESIPSAPTGTVAVGTDGSVSLTRLPQATGEYVARRLYRSGNNGAGPFTFVADLDASSTTYFDDGATRGGTLSFSAPDASGIVLTEDASPLAGTLPNGTYNYRVTFVDSEGQESDPSDPTTSLSVGEDSAIVLSNLLIAPAGQTRRIYRSDENGQGPYRLISETSGLTSTFTDIGLAGTTELRQTSRRSRPDASLVIDPGVTVKARAARIEAAPSTQVLAEGVDGHEVILTSLSDDRYGAGGSFDTTNNGGDLQTAQSPGEWSGIYVGAGANLSLDYATLAYGGGRSKVEGNFTDFNLIEVQQGTARITHSAFERNAAGAPTDSTSERFGRGINEPGVIFVRNSQPIVVDNKFIANDAALVNIDVNSLNTSFVTDIGRSTYHLVDDAGDIDIIDGHVDNQGPLIRDNRLTGNSVNGLEIRGGTLTTAGVWDDTDIVHVVRDEVIVPDNHSEGGLRLESAATQSLVVKLQGDDAGFTATGRPLDISDRIGGTVQVLGNARHPVIMTSLNDCTVGAGLSLSGAVVNNTVLSSGCVEEEVVSRAFADVIVVIDESGSMGGEQLFTIQMITDLEAGLVAAGIGDGTSGVNRYGLVGFGGSSFGGHESGHAHPLGANGALFGSSVEYVAAVPSLQTSGAREDGWEALEFTANTYNYRPDAAKFMILVTDEPRSVLDASLTYQSVLSTVRSTGAILEGILSVDINDVNGMAALAIDSNDNTYSDNGAGGFDVLPNGTITSFGFGGPNGVIPAYADLAFATGGLVGDISIIDAGGPPVTSFSTAIAQNITAQAGALNPAAPGDWRSIQIDQFSNDRNVQAVVEAEAADITIGVDSNGTPDLGEFVGQLATDEYSSDENLRLGFEVEGTIDSPTDADVYSFDAVTGTQVWLDIDSTTFQLDTVVELINDDGVVIASSDNSLAEGNGSEALGINGTLIAPNHVNPLKETAFGGKDFGSTNPRDAGMRVVLPGVTDAEDTYHVRVRSARGTTGSYQLQIRLRETDEVAGSTVEYADIRFATRGVELLGVPAHSPLSGEAVEPQGTTAGNSLANAIDVGNLLNSERGVISIAGNLDDPSGTDVDFYRLEVTHDSVGSADQPVPVVIDLDYADGVALANATLSIFDENGLLIFSSSDSSIAADRPAPGQGDDLDDLSRGSVGPLDPFFGPVNLAPGEYFIAVHADAVRPSVLNSPGARLEPLSHIERLADDGIEGVANPATQLPLLFEADGSNAVPFFLSDVSLFVNYDSGLDESTLVTVDPFTGGLDTVAGEYAQDVADIAFHPNGQLFGYARDLDDNVGQRNGNTDASSGNYFSISPVNGNVTLEGNSGAVSQDPNGNQLDDGWHFEALGISNANAQGTVVAYGVANTDPDGFVQTNRLFRVNPTNGNASSATGQSLDTGTILTQPGRTIIAADVTTLDSQGNAVPIIRDGDQIRGTNNGVPVLLEFETGPDVIVDVDPENGRFIADGTTFTLQIGSQETLFDFNTGSVIEVINPDLIRDGDAIQIRGVDSNGVAAALIFEFAESSDLDAQGNLRLDNPAAIPVAYDASQAEDVVAVAFSNAINDQSAQGNLIVTASTLGGLIALDGETQPPITFPSNALGFRVIADVAPTTALTIDIEITDTSAEIAAAVQAAFNALGSSAVSVGVDGNRLNFSGASGSDFSALKANGIFTQIGTAGVTVGAQAIDVLAEFSDTQVAIEIQNTLVPLSVATTIVDDGINRPQIDIDTGNAEFTEGPALFFADNGRGGLVTGLAFLGDRLYAVDDNGGLYEVRFPFADPFTGTTAVLDYIESSSSDLNGISFTALTNGPESTEGGIYADMLFALDTEGELYAFSADGVLQPVFADGATQISTGLTGANGLAFSDLDRNLWQITNDRDDTGVTNGSSLHFGQGTTGDYDFPGGAHGVTESNTFSLTNYSRDDAPTLYFDYFIETENTSSDIANQTPARDSFRVYVGDDSGEWELVASNNADPLATETRLLDSTGTWRQARVNLGDFAGLDDLRLRFEFSTAATLNMGNIQTGGQDIIAVPADELIDGQQLTVDSSAGPVQFEVDFGKTLIAPTGSAIIPGSTFVVDGVTFQLVLEGTSATNGTAVPYRADQDAVQVAEAIELAIRTRLGDLQIQRLRNQLILADAASVSSSSAVRVADSGSILRQQTITAPSGSAVVLGTTFTVNGTTFEFAIVGTGQPASGNTPVYYLAAFNPGQVAESIEAAILDVFGSTFPVTRNGSQVVLQDVVSASSNSVVTFTPSPVFAIEVAPGMTSTEVAAAIQQALANRFSNGNTLAFKRYRNVVRVMAHDVVNPGPFGLVDELEGDAFGSPGTATGPDNSSLANQFEGVYIDDIIIGFGERGEDAINVATGSGFAANPFAEPNQIGSGEYQIEIRTTSELPATIDGTTQFSNATNIFAIGGAEIADGQTFTLSDGIDSITFEFDDVDSARVAQQGNLAIPYETTLSAPEIAARIAEAINNAATQGFFKIRATHAGSGANRIELSGNVLAEFTGSELTVDATQDSSALAKALFSDDAEVEVDAVGGADSIGLFSGAGSILGIESGIVLSSGSINTALGPNTSASSGSLSTASVGAGSDSTSLTFAVVLDQAGDLSFDFVFASEEYDGTPTDFNDSVSILIDGLNVAFIPDSSTPISVNSLNRDANSNLYNNNATPDSSLRERFGFDGFSDVLTASVTGLLPGRHEITFVVSDVGDTGGDSALFIKGINALDPLTTIQGEQTSADGDENHFRDQGQVIVRANRITRSSQQGIFVGPGQRGVPNLAPLAGVLPHAGPVRNLAEQNLERLVPGPVIENNLVVGNTGGGIFFGGDALPGMAAPVSFGRIINNTVVGGTIGIEVGANVSPTVLNNIVANANTGIAVDPTSETSVLGYNLYSGNGSNTTANVTAGEEAIIMEDLPTEEQILFVNPSAGNYYLAADSPAIDSALDSLQDRSSLIRVRNPLGIAQSPILAPEYDLLGQRRVDGQVSGSEAGQGSNVFKDRGAIDRVDFSGPTAVIVTPRDNDAQGADQNPAIGIVAVSEALDLFSIQLTDGILPIDPQFGAGIDDATVTANKITLLEDGERLERGVDYSFSYDAATDTIFLTPLAGVWNRNSRYDVLFANGDSIQITFPDGSAFSDGDSFTITNDAGNVFTFEFDSGYVLTVPKTLELQIPALGAALGGVTDGQTFEVTSGSQVITFEFDSNSVTGNNTTPIAFVDGASATALGNAVVTALIDADLGLSPVQIGAGTIHLGSQAIHAVDTTGSSLTVSGQAAGVSDGDTFTIDNFAKQVVFEFDLDDDSLNTSDSVIPFSLSETSTQLASKIIGAITAAAVGLTPTNLGDGVVHLGGTDIHTIDVSTTALTLAGQPGVSGDFGLRIESTNGLPSNINDGDQFTISDGVTVTTFEFNNDAIATPGFEIINYSDTTSADALATLVAVAIRNANIGINPQNVGAGFVRLDGATGATIVNSGTAGVAFEGTPGVSGAIAIPFIPDESFTSNDIAVAVANAINDARVGPTATVVDDQVILQDVTGTGLGDIDVGGLPITTSSISSITDIAGNPLQGNQPGGLTQVTIVTGSGLDFGDLPSRYGITLEDNDGARHEVVAGFFLGESIDTDTDGNVSDDASGDDADGIDDEDGVVFNSDFAQFFDGSFTVTASGIVPDVQDGVLDAWVDFNQDGDFADPGEQILTGADLSQGTLLSPSVYENTFTVATPSSAVPGATFARFRLSSSGGLGPNGLATEGEVEDYAVNIVGNPWHNSAIPTDVNGRSGTSLLDALLIINYININGEGSSLPATNTFTPPRFIDVNNDGKASLFDAITVINQINRERSNLAEEGEGSDDSLLASAGTANRPLQTRNAIEVPVGIQPMLDSEALVFDDTETLTQSNFDVVAENDSEDDWLDALAEAASSDREQTATELIIGDLG